MIDRRPLARERSRQVVGGLFLGSDPEQEAVYGQWVGLGGRELKPDARRSVERAKEPESETKDTVQAVEC